MYIPGFWTAYDSLETYRRAQELARGRYQRDLLDGWQALSGSTLRGAAKHQYGLRYRESRENLLRRLIAAGFYVSEARGPRGARILVIKRGSAW